MGFLHGPAGVRHACWSDGHVFAGIVLARLGADVVLTDLVPNLPLLKDNCEANGMLWLCLKPFTMCNSIIVPLLS